MSVIKIRVYVYTGTKIYVYIICGNIHDIFYYMYNTSLQCNHLANEEHPVYTYLYICIHTYIYIYTCIYTQCNRRADEEHSPAQDGSNKGGLKRGQAEATIIAGAVDSTLLAALLQVKT
jgi:hypothetical protein